MKIVKFSSVFLLTIIVWVHPVKAQNIVDIFVYHGAGNTALWNDKEKEFISNMPIKKKKGETVSVQIVNPNPLFYTYEIKQNDFEIKEDLPDITALLTAANLLIVGNSEKGMSADIPYFTTLIALENEIEKAKEIIATSDAPETRKKTDVDFNSRGLQRAIVRLNDKEELSNEPGHFNDTKIADNLSKQLKETENLDPTSVKAFTALNAAYVQKVYEIKALVKSVPTVITSTFTITEKASKIVLIIKPKDPKKEGLARDIKEIVLATVQPFFDRATLELVPVGNVRFANDIREYYLDNKIVKERTKDDVSFVPGFILNANLARFGELKEMAVGLGLGYSISSKNNQFNQFSLSSLFSYRNFLRVGAGVGFSSYPAGLKEGGKVDAALPDNIKNLNDIISYDNKAAFFITFSFTGLKLF